MGIFGVRIFSTLQTERTTLRLSAHLLSGWFDGVFELWVRTLGIDGSILVFEHLRHGTGRDLEPSPALIRRDSERWRSFGVRGSWRISGILEVVRGVVAANHGRSWEVVYVFQDCVGGG